jgi:hypothetical protein
VSHIDEALSARAALRDIDIHALQLASLVEQRKLIGHVADAKAYVLGVGLSCAISER